MKVQTRLSLFSSVVFGIIFAIISVLIYGLFYKNAEKRIYNDLERTSYLTALFYLEEDELNKEEFAKIHEQFRELVSTSDYQVYNSSDSICYGSVSGKIPHETLSRIREKEYLSFSDDIFFYYGIFYADNQGDFIVITKERKKVLSEQLNVLSWILIVSFVIGVLAIIFLSRWLANIAYRPFRLAIKQVNNISTNNLDVKIKLPHTNDELQDLIATFNNLLAKISETFVVQKNFVSYVSHEFKTPLASMLGNLEVFSIKDRTPEEYRQLAGMLIAEIHQLEDTLNTLIIISDLRKESEHFAQIRIDELFWQIINKISERYPGAKIRINTDITPSNEQLLTVTTDRTQLLISLFNLVENAVKYSQGNAVDIHIFKKDGCLSVSITDNGIGIPAGQLANISKPFYRADNTNKIQGSGIGLSIALRIFEKNNIEYNIESKENEGTRISLIFR